MRPYCETQYGRIFCGRHDDTLRKSAPAERAAELLSLRPADFRRCSSCLAVFMPVLSSYLLTLSFKDLPGRKAGTLTAGMFRVAPVRGL